MRKVKFDCHGQHAPAYGCNLPGDNSGEYVNAVDAGALLIEAQQRFRQYEMDVDGEAPADHKKFMQRLSVFLEA